MASFRMLHRSLGPQIRRSASILTKHVSQSSTSIRCSSLSRTVAVELDESIKDKAQIAKEAQKILLPKEAQKILHALASDWSDVADSRDLQVMPMKGAMTNEVYQIKWLTGGKSRKVLVRVYGEGVHVFFDREDEIMTFECMSRNGQGPRLLGRFPNGRVEEFINAETLTAADLRDPEISALIALKLREFHDLDAPGPKNMLLPRRLRNWLRAAQSMCSLEEVEEFHLDDMGKEIDSLENLLSGEDQRIGFCHNDLQYGNIMIDKVTRQITIIDYEYSGFNPVAYDLANHFCEMTANYHTKTPHVLDFSKYPDLEERKRFVQIYLSSSFSGEESKDVEVENLLRDIDKYALASHLLWGLWGVISGHVNNIDFDYMEYARQRFQQYWLRKQIIVGH